MISGSIASMLRETFFRASLRKFSLIRAHAPIADSKKIDEMTSAVLRFPGERLGTFISSFGAADVASCEIIGTQGKLRLDPAYEYAMALKLFVTIDGKTRDAYFPAARSICPRASLFFRLHPEKYRAGTVGRRGIGRRAHCPRPLPRG